MKLRKALEILILITIIGIIIYKVDIKKSIEIITDVNPILFILSLIIDLILLFIIAYGIKVLFDTLKPIKINEWLAIYIPSFLSGLVLPGRAGDITTTLLAKKKGFEYGQSTTLILIDKLITLIIFIPISAIGIFTFLNTKEIYYGIGISILLILGILSLYTNLGRKILKRILGKYAEKFKGFNKTFKEEIKYHKKSLLINIFLTTLRPIINGIIIILLLMSLGYNLGLLDAIIISSISFIVSIIPITPNGLGLREGIGTILLFQVGIPYEASIAMYILFGILNIIISIILIIYYYLFAKKTLTTLESS